MFHVAARALATQALSIFGDHSDVMQVRQTGFALLCAASVQEAHDFALVAHATTLRSRVPFLHFFDGFRTSHELNTIEQLSDDDMRALVPEELIREHRARALNPERPIIRGHRAQPGHVLPGPRDRQPVLRPRARAGPGGDGPAGRAYRPSLRPGRLHGHPEAERVIVIMGSGGETARETVEYLAAAASGSASPRSACTARSRPAS